MWEVLDPLPCSALIWAVFRGAHTYGTALVKFWVGLSVGFGSVFEEDEQETRGEIVG